jgi:hypothetical protein
MSASQPGDQRDGSVRLERFAIAKRSEDSAQVCVGFTAKWLEKCETQIAERATENNAKRGLRSADRRISAERATKNNAKRGLRRADTE